MLMLTIGTFLGRAVVSLAQAKPLLRHFNSQHTAAPHIPHNSTRSHHPQNPDWIMSTLGGYCIGGIQSVKDLYLEVWKLLTSRLPRY